MRSFPWLTGRVVPSAPHLLAREAVARRRAWWARLPFGWKVALWVGVAWLTAPWFVKATLAWWDLAFGAGAAIEWVAPKP